MFPDFSSICMWAEAYLALTCFSFHLIFDHAKIIAGRIIFGLFYNSYYFKTLAPYWDTLRYNNNFESPDLEGQSFLSLNIGLMTKDGFCFES